MFSGLLLLLSCSVHSLIWSLVKLDWFVSVLQPDDDLPHLRQHVSGPHIESFSEQQIQQLPVEPVESTSDLVERLFKIHGDAVRRRNCKRGLFVFGTHL